MNKTKTIYFLSAVVMIIGCYALNLSYSLFVQTEEKEIVNASVPILLYSLTENEFTIPNNSKQIIELEINNNGTTDINYAIRTTKIDGVDVKLVENNPITGTLESSSTKKILIYVSNSNSTETNIVFNLDATYSTLNLIEKDSNIDTENIIKLLNSTIMNDSRIVKNEGTPAFTGIATTEVGMYSTEDDYGTSWYFRGAQSYNYVNFAGLIWRIVRINGDNSIRLILNQTIDSTMNGVSYFNYPLGSYDNAYVGYMYGTINSNNYDSTHENINDSNIKTIVDTFYESYIYNEYSSFDYSKYLADTLFCGDKSGGSFASTSTDYNSLNRLYNNNSPTLECAKEETNNYSRYTSKKDGSTTTSKGVSVNNDLKYPIALLSADELMLAGAFPNVMNYDYYLADENTYNSNSPIYPIWWTMTPATYNANNGANVFTSRINTTDSYSITYAPIYDMAGVRPVINLKPNLIIESGNGERNTPYTIVYN